MTTAAAGTCADRRSVAVMPSMSGMLMSIRTTSGRILAAISIASAPDDAAPTTSMSGSKPSSLARWSRVSEMSSTMRTRIRSAIDLNRFQSSVEANALGLYTGGSATGRWSELPLKVFGDVLRNDGAWVGRENAVLLDEHLEGDAWPVGFRQGVVLVRPKGDREVNLALRVGLLLALGPADDLSLVGLDFNDRDHVATVVLDGWRGGRRDCLARRVGHRRDCRGRRRDCRGRREQRRDDLAVLDDHLGRDVLAALDRDGQFGVGGVGECQLDHVHGQDNVDHVTGDEERANAVDLVQFYGHPQIPAGNGSGDVLAVSHRPRVQEVAAADERLAWRDLAAGDLANDLIHRRECVRTKLGALRDGNRLALDHARGNLIPEVDVLLGADDRGHGLSRWSRSRGWPAGTAASTCYGVGKPTADYGEEKPEQNQQPIGSLHDDTPKGM